MTEGLGDLLRRGVDVVDAPRLDLGELVAEAGRRRRRRRYVVIATAAAAVSVVVLGSVLAAGTGGSRTEGPSPAGTPSRSPSIAVDAAGSRPLVYAEGRTVHVGDKTIRATKPVAFIAPTDDGAVYEATLDGTLRFTDGATTEVIGTSGYTAAPTAHAGVVLTGSSGSLVVWADQSHGREEATSELVVYDTARREEVARIPSLVRGRAATVEYVGDGEVWYDAAGASDRRVYRFDEATGSTTPVPRSDLDAVLRTQPRVFTARAGGGRVVYGQPSFNVVRGQLVAGIHDDVGAIDAAPVTLSDGSQLRLRLPTGYVGPWPADEPLALAVSQWLDDDHVVLWADDGGGDLPAKNGDFLVCRLPHGACRVIVPRTSQSYIAPYLG
jgi:hypothetical protein